jgi:hypothetical protein
MLAVTEAVYILGTRSSGRTTLWLALSQASECVDGRSRKVLTPRSYDPSIGFSQAPSVSRGRVDDVREEKVRISTQQMTA